MGPLHAAGHLGWKAGPPKRRTPPEETRMTAFRQRPLRLGHRGAPLKAKENTLESFRLALGPAWTG